MKPMLATPGPIPVGSEWVYEVKWDGMRLLAETGADGALRLTTRNGNDVTGTFPDLAGLAALGRQAVFDGEVVVLDEHGVPSFEQLSTRLGVVRPARAAELARSVPVTYVVFDLLQLDGEDLRRHPFRQRRDLLTGLRPMPGPFVVPDVFQDGQALLAATAQRGLEGVVAKRLEGTYRSGERSGDWIKQSHRATSDAVVVGWRAGAAGTVASVVLAAPAADGLHYRGTAGSGITAAMGRALASRLQRLDAPAAVHGLVEDVERLQGEGFAWSEPTVPVEVRHLGLSSAGRFRQPVLDRLRADVPAAAEGSDGEPVAVAVAGRTMRVTHLDKVLYPATGTTKAQVMQYYAAVAPHLLALAAGRPVTRRRWPNGVAEAGFFEKNLPAWAPSWIRRAVLPASKDPVTFPVLAADDDAALAWLAAHSALELHTPQWRLDEQGRPMAPDRIVVDLDPGPGSGLADCATVALLMRDLLAADGLAARAVLSGSKGLHLYATLPQPDRSADEVTDYVAGLARRCGRAMPDLVVVTMAKQARAGRVFIDWSQNRAAKTTLAPWSLRGGPQPTAACPVTWDEVAAGALRQLTLDEVMSRLEAGGVPLPW